MASKQVRTRQSGSAVSYLVIGVVLVALVTGGIYALQKNKSTNSSTKPVATTSKSPSVSSSASVKPESSASPKPSSKPSKSVAPSTQAAKPSAPKQNVNNGAGMPATGPSDNLPGAVAFAILLGVTVSYVKSYKARIELFR